MQNGKERSKNRGRSIHRRPLQVKTHKLVGTDDTEEVHDIMKEKMLKSFSEYQKRGSGWRLRRVDLFEIHIGEFQPLRGKGHKPLPESIKRKKAIINMKNSDVGDDPRSKPCRTQLRKDFKNPYRTVQRAKLGRNRISDTPRQYQKIRRK